MQPEAHPPGSLQTWRRSSSSGSRTGSLSWSSWREWDFSPRKKSSEFSQFNLSETRLLCELWHVLFCSSFSRKKTSSQIIWNSTLYNVRVLPDNSFELWTVSQHISWAENKTTTHNLNFFCIQTAVFKMKSLQVFGVWLVFHWFPFLVLVPDFDSMMCTMCLRCNARQSKKCSA